MGGGRKPTWVVVGLGAGWVVTGMVTAVSSFPWEPMKGNGMDIDIVAIELPELGRDSDNQTFYGLGDDAVYSISLSHHGLHMAVGGRGQGPHDGQGSQGSYVRLVEWTGDGAWVESEGFASSYLSSLSSLPRASRSPPPLVCLSSSGNFLVTASGRDVRTYAHERKEWTFLPTNVKVSTGDDDDDDNDVVMVASLACAESLFVLGTPHTHDLRGSASVYGRITKGFRKLAEWIGPKEYAMAGTAVAVDTNGERVAVSSPFDLTDDDDDDDHSVGSVTVYEWDPSRSDYRPLSTVVNGDVNSDVGGRFQSSYFGKSLAMDASGRRLAVGAPLRTNGHGHGGGAVYLYDFSENGRLVLTSTLTGRAAGTTTHPNASSSRFGQVLSMNEEGDRLMVGATGDGGFESPTPGYVTLYVREDDNNEKWTPEWSSIDGGFRVDGHVVALSPGGRRMALASGNDPDEAEVASRLPFTYEIPWHVSPPTVNVDFPVSVVLTYGIGTQADDADAKVLYDDCETHASSTAITTPLEDTDVDTIETNTTTITTIMEEGGAITVQSSDHQSGRLVVTLALNPSKFLDSPFLVWDQSFVGTDPYSIGSLRFCVHTTNYVLTDEPALAAGGRLAVSFLKTRLNLSFDLTNGGKGVPVAFKGLRLAEADEEGVIVNVDIVDDPDRAH